MSAIRNFFSALLSAAIAEPLPVIQAHTPGDLTRLRQLLATPERWTKNMLARSQRGYPVDPTSPVACSWCLMGAVEVVTGDGTPEYYALMKEIRDRIEKRCGFRGISPFNDNPRTTHADILELLA